MRARLDRTTVIVALLAVITVQALLFSAGWILGMFAGAPASITPIAASVRVDPPPPVVAIASVIIEEAPTQTPLSAPLRPPREPSLDSLIREAALQHGLSPMLITAVTRVESDFDPHDVSDKGARGLMQVMPETGLRFGVTADRLFDPAPNIAAGTAYLAWLLDHYHGDLDLALAAYNAGEGAVDHHRGIPPYRETQNYVRKVRAVLARMETKARGARGGLGEVQQARE
jgi:soluble lytic murein transglycosylase-like protein